MDNDLEEDYEGYTVEGLSKTSKIAVIVAGIFMILIGVFVTWKGINDPFKTRGAKNTIIGIGVLLVVGGILSEIIVRRN